MTYTHRNGETERPTEPGTYWIKGTAGNYEGLTSLVEDRTVVDKDEDGNLFVFHPVFDIWDSIDVFNCRWWGPGILPWEDEL